MAGANKNHPATPESRAQPFVKGESRKLNDRADGEPSAGAAQNPQFGQKVDDLRGNPSLQKKTRPFGNEASAVMSEQAHAQAEQLKQHADVRAALDEATTNSSPEKPKAAVKDKVWFGSYVLLLVGLAVLYYLFSLRFFGLPHNIVDYLLRYTRGAILIVLILTLAKAVEVYLIGRVHDTVNQFNLRRILRLLVGLVVLFV